MSERYLTIEEAALELAENTVNDYDILEAIRSCGIDETEFEKLKAAKIKEQQKSFINLLNDARQQGKLTIRDPATKLPYNPKIQRDYYEVMSLYDINAWLKSSNVDYQLGEQAEAVNLISEIKPKRQLQQEDEILRKH